MENLSPSQARNDVLSLPAELRIQIYELIVQESCHELSLDYGQLLKGDDWRIPVRCLATCRRIRNEMLTTFWDI